MSSIQLSDELINDIHQVLTRHDPNTSDTGVAVQYLSALTGVLLANFPNSTLDQKKEFLQQLYGFADQVLTDSHNEMHKPADNASFGIWRPE